MRYGSRLIKLDVCGIKNISSELSFDFLSLSSKNKKIDVAKSNVKAIYGRNGSGKSALINAIDLYKDLVSRFAYLADDKVQKRVTSLINKKNKELSIKLYFAICEDDVILEIYSHQIVVSIIDGKPVVFREKIEQYKGLSLSSETDTLLLIEDGKISFLPESIFAVSKCIADGIETTLGFSSAVSFMSNTTRVNSLIDALKEDMKKYGDNTNIPLLAAAIINIIQFNWDIAVYLDDNDRHKPIDVDKLLRIITKKDDLFIQSSIVGSDEKEIPQNKIKQYEKKVSKLSSFIKIFKPELKNISITKKKNESNYWVSKVFNYPDYSVDEEFESSGIKRLVRIFDYLDMASQGGIVFVDEIDINLNEIYLCKLIEFFMNYGKGQLVLTMHCSAPMGVLKKMKHSIDFIDEKSKEIVSWVNNGHYAPASQYSKGMIKGLPMNIEDFDFLSCFNAEE